MFAIQAYVNHAICRQYLRLVVPCDLLLFFWYWVCLPAARMGSLL